MKEFVSNSVLPAIEQGNPIVGYPMWGWEGEPDGVRRIGIVTDPEAWLHIVDALYLAGKAGFPNSSIYAVLADAIAFRFGMRRK